MTRLSRINRKYSSFLFIDPKTLLPEQLKRFRADIRKRLRWNINQLERMAHLKFDPNDKMVEIRMKEYRKAITQYKGDILTVSKLLP